MIKNDRWIREQAAKGMIAPFEPSLIRQVEDRKVVSFGASSYGYDLRLSPKEFLIFRHIPGTVVNPKRFSKENLEPAQLHEDEDGQFFVIPAHSYGLGVALERLEMPANVTALAIGKSTYARCGIIANCTPTEPMWAGHLTLEFSNSSSADCRIYALEGTVQLLFFEGEPCEVSYADRQGKYQDQPQAVVVARV